MRRSRKHRPDTSGQMTGVPVRTRRRSISLAALLARLGSRRDQHVWTVRCRDERGQRARLLISLTRDGITIAATDLGPVQLTLPEFDRLRGVRPTCPVSFDEIDCFTVQGRAISSSDRLVCS